MKLILKDKIIQENNTLENNKNFKFTYINILSKTNLGNTKSINIVNIKEYFKAKFKNKDKIRDKIRDTITNKNKAKDLDSEESRTLELNIVKESILKAKNWKKTHISNLTYSTSIHLIEEYYRELWLFKNELNSFKIDWENINLTCSIDFLHLLYSSKDFKKLLRKDSIRNIKDINTLRSPQNTKLLINSINIWSVFWLDFDKSYLNKELENFIKLEKINIFRIWEVLNFYYLENIFNTLEKREIIITL